MVASTRFTVSIPTANNRGSPRARIRTERIVRARRARRTTARPRRRRGDSCQAPRPRRPRPFRGRTRRAIPRPLPRSSARSTSTTARNRRPGAPTRGHTRRRGLRSPRPVRRSARATRRARLLPWPRSRARSESPRDHSRWTARRRRASDTRLGTSRGSLRPRPWLPRRHPRVQRTRREARGKEPARFGGREA